MTLPADLLAEAETLAEQRNTTVSAIVSQAMEAGMESLRRKDRAQHTYRQLRASLAGLAETEQFLVDGIHLSSTETPVE